MMVFPIFVLNFLLRYTLRSQSQDSLNRVDQVY